MGVEMMSAIDEAFGHVEVMSAVNEAFEHIEVMSAVDEAMDHVEMMSAIDDAFDHVELMTAIDGAFQHVEALQTAKSSTNMTAIYSSVGALLAIGAGFAIKSKFSAVQVRDEQESLL